MSSISDMHIFIDLELNKVNSGFYDTVLPEEKDYFLNKAQERFVKDRYNAASNPKDKGFEMSQKRIDDLRALLVPNYFDNTYLTAPSDFDYETKMEFYFPEDYWFLTSNRSKIYGNNCSNISVSQTIKKVYYNIIDLSNVNNFNVFKILSPSSAVLIQNLNYSQEDKTLFMIDLVTQWNNNYASIYGWTFYIESFYSINSPGNIIVISKDAPGQAIKTQYLETISTFLTNQYLNFYYYTATGGTEQIVTNRFAQQDDIYSMMQDPFNDTILFAPLIAIHENKIDVFIDKNKFIVKEIAISYIRRPKLMSLSLNQSCELAEHTHAEILRDAVNLLLENFEAGNRLQTSLQVENTNE